MPGFSLKPVVKKEPITPEMISSICSKYTSPSGNLSRLRTVALLLLLIVHFYALMSDVNFHNSGYVKITLASSRTDAYTDSSSVLLAKTGNVSFPYTILSRYFVFRNAIYSKSTLSYSLGSQPKARELLPNSSVELGIPKTSYGLHSLRSGGASAAANAGISDRCLNDVVPGNRIVQRMAIVKTTSIPFFQFLFLRSIILFKLFFIFEMGQFMSDQ